MKKIVFVGNVGLVINSFIKEYIIALSGDYEVYLIYNRNTEPLNISFPDSIRIVHYEIKRKFSFSDFYFFLFLYKFLRKNNVDATISITPKVGFITNIVGFFVGVPIRIHFFTGQIWINLKGLKRSIVKMIDKLLFSLTTHQLIDSPTQLAFLRSEGLAVNKNAYSVHNGSICGVDIDRFKRNEAYRHSLRSKYNIDNRIVLLYVGRLDPEKGVTDLLDAFASLNREDTCLLLVGPDEMKIQQVFKNYKAAGEVIYHGMTYKPELFYSAGDIFCYVSHREGFGLSAIEASACGLPVIGTNIVGLSDAISDNKTGLLVSPKNKVELVNAINKLLNDKELREKMGQNGRLYVEKYFSKNHVQSGYISLLKKIIR
jgi:glycosyltransferase involved in cell wall biosynthesis